MEELEEDPTFDETPMCYERMALWLCNVLRRRDRSRLDVMKLWKVFEQVMRIGHASAGPSKRATITGAAATPLSNSLGAASTSSWSPRPSFETGTSLGSRTWLSQPSTRSK